jgi:lipid II:glycine glycyltransferase (peptidoglycan interpeptide bridge formation enzyme)
MNGLFPVLIAAAVLATFGVLATGIVSMIRGGEFNRKYGNKLMQWRVIMQAVALGLVMLALFLGAR